MCDAGLIAVGRIGGGGGVAGQVRVARGRRGVRHHVGTVPPWDMCGEVCCRKCAAVVVVVLCGAHQFVPFFFLNRKLFLKSVRRRQGYSTKHTVRQ